MKINHNISAIKSYTKLKRTNNSLQDSIERLSSGYRINKAADDAAGMAISQKMRSQIRGLEQASRNAADGVSVIETAEGALNEVENMLQRMRELSVQAVNETNTAEDRAHIQSEIEQLGKEIDRISVDTEFNTKKVLNGDADRQFYANKSGVKVKSVSDGVEAKTYTVTVKEVGTKAEATGTKIDPNNSGAAPATGKITINDESIEIEKGTSLASAFESIRKLGETVDVEVTKGTDAANNEIFVFTSKYEGSAQKVEISCEDSQLAAFLGLTTTTVTEKGTDANIELGNGFDQATSNKSIDGNHITILGKDGFEMKFDLSDPSVFDNDGDGSVDVADATIGLTVLDAGPITLQVGSNEGQTIVVGIPRVDTETLEIDKINVQSTDGASEAIDSLDFAINKVSTIRANLGAYENRLDHCINNLDTSNENITEALTRIDDLDMAEEMTKYSQLNILQQAGTAMLSQANQMPQTILSMLQG